MTRVFHLAGDLGPRAAAKQLSLIATSLPRDRFTQAVGVLTPGGPFTEAIAAAGIEVLRLPVRHVIDLTRLTTVARAVSDFRPDVVHVWGSFAARVAASLRFPSFVVSCCGSTGTGLTGWLTRKALRAARAVTAATEAEAEQLRSTGVTATVVPLAVARPTTQIDPTEFRKAVGIPEDGRLIVSAGGFDAAAGLRTAVWAFDILKYADPALHLVLFGDGPERGRVARFSHAVGFDDDRVRFAGLRSDTATAVGLAEVAWVTHLRGGVNFALEAMAAAVPVVAFHNRDAAEAVTDGVTGRLVPSGDRIRLAAASTELLENPLERARLGAAGRAKAETQFAVQSVVERFAALYHDVTSATP